MTMEDRSRARRERLVAHRARSFEDAEDWDLEFWQSRTPEERLSALVAIRKDVELVEASRESGTRKDPDIKDRIDDPRHAEDVRVQRKVKERRERE